MPPKPRSTRAAGVAVAARTKSKRASRTATSSTPREATPTRGERTTMRTHHAIGFSVVSALLLTVGAAIVDDVAAQPVTAEPPFKPSTAAQVTLVGSGAKRGRTDGDMRLRYPGFEQTTLVATQGHIVMITMESV